MTAAELPTHRRFVLFRETDVTGVSGTGAVAEGVEFSDGIVVLRWRGVHSSTVMWWNLADALAIHGHDGLTRVRWIDPPDFSDCEDDAEDYGEDDAAEVAR